MISTLLRFASPYRKVKCFLVSSSPIVYATILHLQKQEIYMVQPEGYVDNNKPNHVCLLKKSLYGLKQAPRMWNKKINDYLVSCGFTRCISDPCLYFKRTENSFHILGLFVDDLLQGASDPSDLVSMRKELEKIFKMKDLGDPTFCLGIEMKRDMEHKTTKFGLNRYTRVLLEKFGMEDCNKVDTPQEVNGKIPLATPSCNIGSPEAYRKAVGSLVYLMSRTRPDIACAVRAVSEHLAAPTSVAWAALKRIFRYLKGTIDYGITYRASDVNMGMHGVSDADWGGCINTRRSVTGSLVYSGCNLLMWRSTKQHTTALSSTEAEYMALTDTLKEVLWLKQLLGELGFGQFGPVTIFEDNAGCIKLSKNPIILSRSKHIDIKHHFIRDHVELGTVKIVHKPGTEVVADALTKGLSREVFQKHKNSMNAGVLGLRESVKLGGGVSREHVALGCNT